jgi:hypothetical protein
VAGGAWGEDTGAGGGGGGWLAGLGAKIQGQGEEEVGGWRGLGRRYRGRGRRRWVRDGPAVSVGGWLIVSGQHRDIVLGALLHNAILPICHPYP